MKTPEERMGAEIMDKLNQVLILLGMVLVNNLGPEATLTEKARLLKVAGLDNSTIADVLNTTPGSIATLLYNIKKGKRKRRR